MDNELFVKRLKELAEIKQIKEPISGAIRMPTDPEPVWRNGEEFVISKNNNPTLAYEIIRLHPIIKDCEDCGKKDVVDRSVQRKLYEYPKTHWRVSCSHCKMNRHPDTGEFSIPNNIVNPFFHGYYAVKK